MNILGISAFYHDSAAALIVNGRVVAACEEERFSRIKHDNAFPHQAIARVLQLGNLAIDDVDVVAYYEKPLLKFERILETFVRTYPWSLRPFLRALPEYLGQKMHLEHIIRSNGGFTKKILFVPHHVSHAAAAYYTSPFTNAAILTIDGVGEYQTTGLWKGIGETITPIAAIEFPHSLGLLYSTITAFLGFKINEDEYKVMGLSAYGAPIYEYLIQKLITVKTDGSFRLNLRSFGFETSFQMWNKKLEQLLGPPRKPNEPITKCHKDIAASLQVVTEDILIRILNHLYTKTKTQNLVLSGGVALNALANGKFYTKTPFRHTHILGPASDSGTAIGAALYAYTQLTRPKHHEEIRSLSLGTSYADSDVKRILSLYPISFREFDEEQKLLDAVVTRLVKKQIIGWFWGAMEFGPRALGNRSILCSPYPKSMKTTMNIIKRREQFRPFAGSVLQEKVHEYFDVPEKNHASPFMNFCFLVKEQKRNALAAIVHKDNTCRIQTVSPINGRYDRLIKAFYKKTRLGCILNTSFNLKGEPIVETPRQAIEDFLKTPMNALVINNFLITKP